MFGATDNLSLPLRSTFPLLLLSLSCTLCGIERWLRTHDRSAGEEIDDVNKYASFGGSMATMPSGAP